MKKISFCFAMILTLLIFGGCAQTDEIPPHVVPPQQEDVHEQEEAPQEGDDIQQEDDTQEGDGSQREDVPQLESPAVFGEIRRDADFVHEWADTMVDAPALSRPLSYQEIMALYFEWPEVRGYVIANREALTFESLYEFFLAEIQGQFDSFFIDLGDGYGYFYQRDIYSEFLFLYVPLEHILFMGGGWGPQPIAMVKQVGDGLNIIPTLHLPSFETIGELVEWGSENDIEVIQICEEGKHLPIENLSAPYEFPFIPKVWTFPGDSIYVIVL
jgi:hypothetical protein